MHNRVGRSSGTRNRAFDVQKTFGSYACRCAAWQKMENNTNTDQEATFELLRLTPNKEGIVGELFFPGVLRATVILAASRESLQRTVTGLSSEYTEGSLQGDDQEPEEEIDRFKMFEKNSFRSPKFWLQWNGTLLQNSSKSTEEASEIKISEMGYVVFSGNDCRKFKGTISCSLLGWKDVAISGRKVVARSESDRPVAWGSDGTTV
ncbi:hypothetical protein N0V90_002912 [Kalmusia sp. IMI 367209]|nr:hypothetical protein N0V90_002912 [Kalmusia sp. IMI 367209]